MMLLPVLAWLSYVFIIAFDVWLYRLAGRRFPAKRKYLIPFLMISLVWPALVTIWFFALFDPGMSVEHPGRYLVREGFWYTFDTRNPLLAFVYFNREIRGYLPAILALIDVLILGTIICIPIYLITLVRRWWIK